MNTKPSSLHSEKDDALQSFPDSADETSPTRIENGKIEGVFLSEEEALKKAREDPDSTCPIYVTFGRDDVSNPRNFAAWKKWYITCLVSFTNVLTCLCAGGYSSGGDGIKAEFGVSSEVITVGLSMYILGFAIGPLLLAPLSEYYGRSPIYFGAWFILVIFQLPLALAPNIGTIIVCRFIAGLGGSAPLTNTGGTISDLFERNLSGNAMRIYGVSSTFGPPFALMISGYVGEDLGWRYIFWMFMGITGGVWIIMLLTLPETRHSTILEKKAKRVRNTLIKEGHANAAILEHIGDAHSKGEKRSVHALFATNLTRPIRFLCTEPITLGAAAYNGFIYGIVYLFNESVPLVFGQNHDFSVGEQGLAFTGIAVGVLIAAAFHPLQEKYYLKKVAENDGKGVPEARMYQARFGAFLLPISFFWFAWCSYSSVHWIVPIIASSLFGAGQYIVVLGILNYVVDSYQSYSASALAGVILIRNVVGAGFPLFGRQMYTTLGYEWAGSLLGFLSLLFIPIVWWWFYKGESLRMKSPWAREHFLQDEDSPH